uniref:Uncharacterized protein n=1 Tax=Leersia perrieri TaxID=77586 RepID=A0A0D9WWA4_9ORYZ
MLHGVLTSPCLRPPPPLRAFPTPATRLPGAPQTLTLRPLRLPRGLRSSSPAPPRAAAEAAASAVGGLLAPLSTLEVGLRSVNLAPLRAPVAAAMSAVVRWLGVYREVLLVGVLFSWFPNIPWDRQPFSALRDLCDPFLALCREVMPPVFGRKLDLSPLIAFMAIDIIIMILRPQPRMNWWMLVGKLGFTMGAQAIFGQSTRDGARQEAVA